MNEQNQNIVSFLSEKMKRKQTASSADDMAATMQAYLANERAMRAQQLRESASSGGEVICMQGMRAV